jgi:glycosyltransferase involved in cell wall biosynthesis
MMEDMNIEKLKFHPNNRLGLKRIILVFEKRLVEKCMKKADLVLPVSDTMKKELICHGIPREKMYTVPLGIDPEFITKQVQREELGLEQGALVLYFGAVKRIRNLDFLLLAFARVVNRMRGARLLILGITDQDKEEVGRLKKVAMRLGLEDRIIWRESVPRRMVFQYIATSDVCVSPIPPIYAYKFASPTKLVEAMGIGRPVVANDLPEQKKLIQDSGGGICVGYDPEVFGNAIIELLENPEERKQMGRKGKTFVLTHRSYPQMALELEKLYCGLLKKER